MDGLDRYKLGQSHKIGNGGVRELVQRVRCSHLLDPDARWEHRVMSNLALESHMLCGFWNDYSPATQAGLLDPEVAVGEKHLEGLRVWVCRDSAGYRLYSRTIDPCNLFPERLPALIGTFVMSCQSNLPARAIFDGILTLKDRRIKQTIERMGIKLVGDRPQRVLWELMRHPDSLAMQSRHVLTELTLFDYVFGDGEWRGDLPWSARRAALESFRFDSRQITLTKVYSPAKAVSLMTQHGWDGVVIKKKGSPYRASPSRSTRWVKIQPEPPEPWYGVTDWYSFEPTTHPVPDV